MDTTYSTQNTSVLHQRQTNRHIRILLALIDLQEKLKFLFSADLSTPNVQTGSITPNSFEASWNNINYPADSWLVELSKVEDEEDVGYPDSEKDYTLVKVM